MSGAENWLWSADHRLPSSMEHGDEFMRIMAAELERIAWCREEMFAINMAVGEALVNAIKHGNGHSPQKEVCVIARANESQFFIEIVDEGEGFDPTLVPDPTDDKNLERAGGRGLMLMQTFMDEVRFNELGTRVVMIKYATPRQRQSRDDDSDNARD